jgi:PAS domain S-box-containing protein
METYMTEKFSVLAGIASDWWWEANAELRLTFLSDQFTETFGLAASSALGRPCTEIVHADYDSAKGRDHLEDLANHRRYRNFEAMIFDSRGVLRPVRLSGTPVFSAVGMFEGYIGVGHDLTELRHSEQEAVAHAANVESILQNIDQGVVLFDSDLRIVKYNRRLAEFLQVPDDQVARGTSFEQVVRFMANRGEYEGEDTEAVVAERMRLIRLKTPFVGERRRRDGRIISVTFNPLPTGGSVMTYSDVTEMRYRETRQRELTEKLQQEQTRSVMAQSVAKVGSWDTDLSSLAVVWSAETFRIFELDPSAVSPTHEGFLSFVHPADRTAVDEAFRQSFATREICTIEHRIVTPVGQLKFVVERWQTYVDDAGKPLRAVGTCQDFTEFRLTQQKADEAANLLRVAGQAARLGGWVAEIDTGRVVWSEVTAAIHDEPPGFSPTVEKALDYYLPEYRQLMAKAFLGCAQEGTPFDEALQIITAKGNLVWVRSIGEAVRGQDGKIISVHGAFQDISILKAQEAQLTLLDTAISKLNDIVLITEAAPLDEPGPRIVYANPAFTKLTGYDVPEVLGKTPRFLQGPKTSREYARIRAALEACQPVHAEVSNFTKDRREYVVEIDIAPIIDSAGNATHFVAVQRDVTERNAIQQKLLESEQRFRTVTQVTTDYVWDWDIVANTMWRNDRGQAWFGPSSPVTPFSPAWDKLFHPEDLVRTRAVLRAAIEGSTNEWSDEYRLRRADGSYAQVVARAAVKRNDAGKAIRMVGSTVDVSEQRRLEEQLRQSQKLDALGKLTGGVAHDFNNILMVIMANVEQMLDEEYEATDAKRHLERISGAAARATQLTRQLLAFSRKQTLRPERTNLNDLTAATGGLLRRTLGEHIEIDMQLADDLWITETDRAQVEAALINLCVNARDAMPEGGRLLIETRNVLLDEDYVAQNLEAIGGDYVMLSITDTGTGIPPDVLKKVFEPFFTTKEVGKGTGLGLSMVYGFAKQSKGHVAIYSEVGHGTAVKLYLPRGKQMVGEEVVDKRVQVPRGTERILVVEDDEQVRIIVVKQLTGLGYAVTAAANGAEALAILGTGQSFDLLLTDVIMPGLFNGKALADEAKRRNPILRILFMSGYSQDAISTLGILNEGIALISKPFSRADLARAVRDMLETLPTEA